MKKAEQTFASSLADVRVGMKGIIASTCRSGKCHHVMLTSRFLRDQIPARRPLPSAKNSLSALLEANDINQRLSATIACVFDAAMRWAVREYSLTTYCLRALI